MRMTNVYIFNIVLLLILLPALPHTIICLRSWNRCDCLQETKGQVAIIMEFL